MTDFRAFTLSAGSILEQIATDVLVLPSSVFSNQNTMPRMWTAIWDTGATKSCIAKRIVDELNLIAVGRTSIGTANGITDANTYLVDIGLPNGVTVKNILVTCADLGDDDVLIGMDIITKGDFSINLTGLCTSTKAFIYTKLHHFKTVINEILAECRSTFSLSFCICW
ncbi:MAG: retroviral-like aspartic protease family protein [Treponema sp.]|nr:retroviral-like aspartic protease family protein [Treponema sp.]